MKRFGRYMLRIGTFATMLTFVGLLLLNAGWISPKPMAQRTHTDTYHSYTDVYTHHGVVHYDKWKYSWVTH